MKRAQVLLSSMAGLLSLAATCETDLVDDPSFQLWCGEALCAWDLEEGEIRKVPTWHEHDYGVELVDAPVVLSQEARRSASCVRIEITSQIEPGADVSVEVDQQGDGHAEWIVPIGASDDFVREVQEVRLSLSNVGVFYVRKSGPGQAVVGRLRISDECAE